MNKILIVLFAGLFLNFADPEAFKPFYWLEGTWTMVKANGNKRLESWVKKDPTTLTGKGQKVAGSDTTLLETLELSMKDDQIWYNTTVKDQNKGAQVPFKLVSSKNNHFVFENGTHDFPQRIVYTFKPTKPDPSLIVSLGDTLSVKLEKMDGSMAESFNFYRKAKPAAPKN